MDVRCEKCQTEYELDEARLKPGGVTVKCTNCGHMFKIRKRAITNVGAVPAGQQRPRAPSGPALPPSGLPRADSILANGDEGPTTIERQWLIRLENGDQKSCRELATLQQWIVAGVVTRESLISRTGKTWKRLGDIAELAQYFDVADEARTTRDGRRAAPTPPPVVHRGTMMGVGQGPTAKAAGGTILPDDDDGDGIRITGNYAANKPVNAPPPTPPKVPFGAKTPPMGSIAARPPAPAPAPAPAPVVRRPITQPPPPPAKRAESPRPAEQVPPPPPPAPPVTPATPPPRPAMAPPPDGRHTAAWASDTVKADHGEQPYVGKLSAIADEPAFAGRVRVSDEAGFSTGQVKLLDDEDDDDLLSRSRGSRAGLWIVLVVLLVGGAAAAGIYVFVIKKDATQTAKAPADAPVVAVAPDAAPVITPPVAIDAAEPPPVSPLETARGELLADNEAQLKKAFDSIAALPNKDEPAAQAVRAHLGVALAQALLDRAGLVSDKGEADKLRKEAKALALDAASSAQRALKAGADDPAANLAMAGVLRLQGKPARDVKRYLDAARAKAGKEWGRDLALHDALLLARDLKLEDARAGLAAIDQGDGKLEISNDVRARFHLALIALAQGKTAEAKPLVEQVLAAQPEHAGARALLAKLETVVVKSDPIPPEEPKGSGATRPNPNPNPPDPREPREPPVSGGSYDSLLARANKLADSNCTKALELYGKALESKPNGVEALSGMGYCHIDAKQFASAFSKFRAALAVSSRYEPALWGIAEAYQQQGRKEQAIEAYKAYLEVYPGSAKAQKQLERLGGGDGGTPNGGNGSAAPPPPPPTPPTPTPTPTEGAGSGSG